MRYFLGFSGLLTMALSSTGLAQSTPGPTTTDFSTSGGMNVPTSVTSQLPITFVTTMTTMARPTKSPVPGKCECGTGTCFTPEICSIECTTIYDECCAVPGADIAICKDKYTVCLGYNPFIVVPWVKPTVCKHGDSGKTDYGHKEVEVTVEECCIQCTTVYDECCAVPGADIAICKEKYTICLGYNPWDVTPFVKPTVCKHGEDYGSKGNNNKGGSSSSSSSEEECCVQCTTVYDECCSIDGHDIEVCKKEYVVCLGYNPWDVTPFVKPTVCKHGEDSGSKGNNNGGSSSSSSKSDDYSKTSGSKSDSSSKSGSDEECAVECTTVYKACCDASGAIIETCKTAYTTCLGFNPWDVTPYVEPTVCKKGGKPSGDDAVIVSGGERVRPVLALLAMGAIALL